MPDGGAGGGGGAWARDGICCDIVNWAAGGEDVSIAVLRARCAV